MRDYWYKDKEGGSLLKMEKARIASWRLDVDYCCLLHSTCQIGNKMESGQAKNV